MPCKSCTSVNQSACPAEINIHPPEGLKNLDKPTTWAFPSLTICMDCGFSEFVLSEAELNRLRQHRARYWDA